MKSKILGIILLVLAFICFGMYFVYGSKPSNYIVTFDSDGGSIVQEQVINSGEKVTKPIDPVKENNDFIEWQLNGISYNFDSAVNSDMTLKALWQPYVVHAIKTTLDGTEYTADVRDGMQINIENFSFPNKEGYRVALYNENGDEFDINLPITTDLVLTAKYVEIKTFTVKFDSNGGTRVNDVKVEETNQVTEPTTTRDGYIFDGWYLNNEKFDFATPISKNITLKAKWNDGVKYTVTFTVDGNDYKKVEVRENTQVSKPESPKKKGSKFVEWQLDGKTFDFNTKITGNLTLTSVFEEVKSYTVKFDSDGGSSVKSQEVPVGDKVTKPTNPTKTGYNFIEWQLNGKAYDFSKVVEENLTLKAKWEKEKNKYTVTFDSNGGNNINSQTVVEGEKATKPSSPTKSNHIFEEWLYENKTFDFTTPITKNITLTARYRLLKNYTVTFDTDGGSTVANQTVIEGNKVVKPANPTKDNFTFGGWVLDDKPYDFNSVVNKDLTLKAVWQNGPSTPDVPSEDESTKG